MKKLLSLLSAGILTLTGVGSVVSCSQKGTTIMEDIQEELSQNTEIIETIKKESLNFFNKFWEKNQIIDISDEVREKMKPSFNNLVDKVKQEAKQGPVVINSENFDQYRMINDFYNDFKIEFDNFNGILAKRYSNYFANEKPLVLDAEDVIFKGNFINFEELQQFGAGFVKDIKAVTVTYEIKYSIRFKGQYNPVKMDGAMVITDNYEELKDTSKLVSDYVIGKLKGLYDGDNYIILNSQKNIVNNMNIRNIAMEIPNKVKDYLTIIFGNSIVFLQEYIYTEQIGFGSQLNTVNHRSVSIITLQKKQGKLPDEISDDNFVDWYMNTVLPKNTIIDPKFPEAKTLYEFRISNDKILLAGLPLSNGAKKPLEEFFLLIKKDDLRKKVQLFAREVIAFYKMYQIESYWTKTIFYLPKHLFSGVINITNTSSISIGYSLKEIFNFITKSFTNEGKQSLNSYIARCYYETCSGGKIDILRNINIEDSVTFTFDGAQKGESQLEAINIHFEDTFFLGLVHIGEDTMGNQVEFKLKR